MHSILFLPLITMEILRQNTQSSEDIGRREGGLRRDRRTQGVTQQVVLWMFVCFASQFRQQDSPQPREADKRSPSEYLFPLASPLQDWEEGSSAGQNPFDKTCSTPGDHTKEAMPLPTGRCRHWKMKPYGPSHPIRMMRCPLSPYQAPLHAKINSK